jgi:hypothetical protein
MKWGTEKVYKFNGKRKLAMHESTINIAGNQQDGLNLNCMHEYYVPSILFNIYSPNSSIRFSLLSRNFLSASLHF